MINPPSEVYSISLMNQYIFNLFSVSFPLLGGILLKFYADERNYPALPIGDLEITW